MSQSINLYEERLRPNREWLTARRLALLALLVLALVLGAAAWASREAARKQEDAARWRAQAEERQTQLTALAKTVSERRVSPELAAELEKIKAALAQRRAVVDELESGRWGRSAGFSEIFAGFSRQAPFNPKLWLTGFDVSRGGDEIEIRGRALEAAALPGYVRSLGGEPAFRGRRFSGLEMLDARFKEKADGATPGADSGKTAAPPRWVEFTLRSETVSGAPGATKAGGAP
ncbi:MAG: PilN domain-containing protein [Candidatus Accumulibacter sp.]|jgi:MSHA biogenesis protein MshI|nr:PilN domain-containing protein [Accumulibacter sp.]